MPEPKHQTIRVLESNGRCYVTLDNVTYLLSPEVFAEHDNNCDGHCGANEAVVKHRHENNGGRIDSKFLTDEQEILLHQWNEMRILI